jgi:hypothetical protein
VRPFTHAGLDFFGPLLCQNKKHYVLIFVCAVVRAVHLEMTASVNSEDTKNAIRRFMARRGTPVAVYSDNAATFLNVSRSFLPEWHFIPPRAPWWGGFYERAVGVVKRSLRSTLMFASLSPDELQTTLAEVEEAINRRPLATPSVDSENILTPAHFLFGAPPSVEMFPIADYSVPSFAAAWRNRVFFSAQCWRAFRKMYLSTIRSWRSRDGESEFLPRVGELVLVEAPQLPRLRWNIGRVLGVRRHDADVVIRGKTSSQALRNLYPLEVESLEEIPTDLGSTPSLAVEKMSGPGEGSLCVGADVSSGFCQDSCEILTTLKFRLSVFSVTETSKWGWCIRVAYLQVEEAPRRLGVTAQLNVFRIHGVF